MNLAVHDFKNCSNFFVILHVWMVSFLHELMQYANSNHISNQNKLHIWMVFPFMNWCNMFIQIKYLIKLSLTERTFEMIFFLMNWGYMFIQLIFHLKLDITYFTFEWFLSFMNWCNMQIQIIFQTKINFTFEWFLIYLDQIK